MRLRRILRKLGLSVLALLVFLVSAEILARLAEPGSFSLYDTRPYLPDPDLEHVHEPGFQGRWDSSWYEINSRGRRGPEVAPTFDPDEFRVVCLGDSCTFGKGVVEADTWPRKLEGLLREHMGPERRPVVFNLGVNGYSMWQYARVLEQQARELEPHLVIVGYNVNDYDSAATLADMLVFSGLAVEERAPPPAGAGDGAERSSGATTGGAPEVPAEAAVESSSPRPEAPLPSTSAPASVEHGPSADVGKKDSLRKRLRSLLPKGLRDKLNRLALYRFLRASYYDWNRERDYKRMAAIVHTLGTKGAEQQGRILAEESGLLGQLVETAGQCNARVVLFLFPFEAMVCIDGFDPGPEQFVRDLADELSIGFVDVPGAFRVRLGEVGERERLFVRGDRYHPNPAGYQVVAEAVLARLLELGWLEPRQ